MRRFHPSLSSVPAASLPLTGSLLSLALGRFALLLTGCGAGEPVGDLQSRDLHGIVHAGQQPVTGAPLQMYAVGSTGDASATTLLLSVPVTTSDGTSNPANSSAITGNQLNQLPAGSLTITGDFICPTPNSQVYLVAVGGNPGLGSNKTNPALAMMAVLGRCGVLAASTYASMDKLTTVGSLASLTPYMNTLTTLGSGDADAVQPLIALDLARTYTDASTGGVPGLGLQPKYYASSLELAHWPTFWQTASTPNGTTICPQLFTLATPPGGAAPTDTITATLDILKFPTNNATAISAY